MKRLALVLAVSFAACGHYDFARTGDGGITSADGVGDDGPTTDDAGADGGSLPVGLLLWFSFESDGFLLDRVSGTEAECADCPVATTRPGGSLAAAFSNGACLRFRTPVATPNEFTFMLWAQVSIGSNSMLYTRKSTSTAMVANVFDVDSISAGEEYIRVAAGGRDGTGMPAFGEWHHVAGVMSTGALTMYVDGVVVATDPGPVSLSYVVVDEAILIGCDISGGNAGSFLLGSVDEVKLYARALTSSEIAEAVQ